MELKIPPPILLLIAAMLIFLCPTFTEPNLFYRIGAFIFLFCGVLVDILGLVAFRQKKTTVNPLSPEKTTFLVTQGIYRFTRNPMYLGMTFLLVAWALWLGNIMALVIVWCFIGYLTRFQILPEERILAQKFGESFQDYQQNVPRWLW